MCSDEKICFAHATQIINEIMEVPAKLLPGPEGGPSKMLDYRKGLTINEGRIVAEFHLAMSITTVSEENGTPLMEPLVAFDSLLNVHAQDVSLAESIVLGGFLGQCAACLAAFEASKVWTTSWTVKEVQDVLDATEAHHEKLKKFFQTFHGEPKEEEPIIN